MIRAGDCTKCGTALWRRLTHPVTGRVTLLWPDPSSVYVVAQAVLPEDTIETPGIAYCVSCAPPVGGPVARIESAAQRYAEHFSEAFGARLRGLCKAHKTALAPVRAQWQQERETVTHQIPGPDAALPREASVAMRGNAPRG